MTRRRIIGVLLLAVILAPFVLALLILYAPRNLALHRLPGGLRSVSSFDEPPHLQHEDVCFFSHAELSARATPLPCPGDDNGCGDGDGRLLRLSGSLVRPAQSSPARNHNATVVVVHGHGSHRHGRQGRQLSVAEKAALPLALAGYHVLAVDLRNHGRSDAYGPVSFGDRESLDVLAAVQFVRGCLARRLGLDAGRVGIYAESMGAASSLIAVGRYAMTDVRAAWLDSPYTTFREALYYRLVGEYGLPRLAVDAVWLSMQLLAKLISGVKLSHADPLSFVTFVQAPVMFSHGRRDRIVPFEHGQHLVRAAQLSSQHIGKPAVVESLWYDGHHTEAYLDQRMPDALISFFDQYLI